MWIDLFTFDWIFTLRKISAAPPSGCAKGRPRKLTRLTAAFCSFWGLHRWHHIASDGCLRFDLSENTGENIFCSDAKPCAVEIGTCWGSGSTATNHGFPADQPRLWLLVCLLRSIWYSGIASSPRWFFIPLNTIILTWNDMNIFQDVCSGDHFQCWSTFFPVSCAKCRHHSKHFDIEHARREVSPTPWWCCN